MQAAASMQLRLLRWTPVLLYFLCFSCHIRAEDSEDDPSSVEGCFSHETQGPDTAAPGPERVLDQALGRLDAPSTRFYLEEDASDWVGGASDNSDIAQDLPVSPVASIQVEDSYSPNGRPNISSAAEATLPAPPENRSALGDTTATDAHHAENSERQGRQGQQAFTLFMEQ